jgi:hypothetical protein
MVTRFDESMQAAGALAVPHTTVALMSNELIEGE